MAMNYNFLSHADAAQINRNLVLHYIMRQGKATRTGIWKSMNISRAAVTQIIQHLLESGIIRETGEKQSGTRRSASYLCVSSDVGYEYIFDWPSRSLYLVDLCGKICDKLPLNFSTAAPPPSYFASVLLEGVATLDRIHPDEAAKVMGFGAILPGVSDPERCTVLFSVELGWQNVDLGFLLRERFGDQVFLERTCNVLALGESVIGSAKDSEHSLMIFIDSTGIGMSVIHDGQCLYGENCMYGELGHVKLPVDVICSCGQKGCLEAVVKEQMFHNGGVVDEQVMEYISYGISTAINLVDPSVVLLSGDLLQPLESSQRQYFVDCIREKVTNIRSRVLQFYICHNDVNTEIRGMSQYMFDCFFPIK